MRKFKNFFSDMHYETLLVRNHINGSSSLLETLLERPELRDRDGHMEMLYLRVRGWIMSAAKLDHPSDLQALACVCRSLLESVVDIALLANDPTNSSGEKMRWWDLSAKLQMAIAFVQFNQEIRTGKNSPDVEAAKDFIQRNLTFVEGIRKNLWPQFVDRKGRPNHPPRWTGKPDIRPDIQQLDHSPLRKLIHRNMSKGLLHYYGTEYQRLNRTIHGSGLIGVRGSFRLLTVRAAYACWACASLAMLCHQIVFIDRGLDKHFPELRDKWEHLRKVRGSSFIYHMREIESEDI